jgi:hypothetical protein
VASFQIDIHQNDQATQQSCDQKICQYAILFIALTAMYFLRGNQAAAPFALKEILPIILEETTIQGVRPPEITLHMLLCNQQCQGVHYLGGMPI